MKLAAEGANLEGDLLGLARDFARAPKQKVNGISSAHRLELALLDPRVAREIGKVAAYLLENWISPIQVGWRKTARGTLAVARASR